MDNSQEKLAFAPTEFQDAVQEYNDLMEQYPTVLTTRSPLDPNSQEPDPRMLEECVVIDAILEINRVAEEYDIPKAKEYVAEIAYTFVEKYMLTDGYGFCYFSIMVGEEKKTASEKHNAMWELRCQGEKLQKAKDEAKRKKEAAELEVQVRNTSCNHYYQSANRIQLRKSMADYKKLRPNTAAKFIFTTANKGM